MNLRHAAALGLFVVYLMIPPLAENSNKPQADLPLSQWWQHQAFDSPQECEDSKDRYLHKYEDNAKKEQKMKTYWNGMMESVVQGLCVASDDPRLKGQ
jgi:hypothetical protein